MKIYTFIILTLLSANILVCRADCSNCQKASDNCYINSSINNGNIIDVSGANKSSTKYQNCDMYVWDGTSSTIQIRAYAKTWEAWKDAYMNSNYVRCELNGTTTKSCTKGSYVKNMGYVVTAKISVSELKQEMTSICFSLYEAVAGTTCYWNYYHSNTIYIKKSTYYSITASATNGTVIGGGKYEKNTKVKLTATPAECYEFVRWSDGNTDNPRTIVVTGDATYMAEFEKITYSIRGKEATGGKVVVEK